MSKDAHSMCPSLTEQWTTVVGKHGGTQIMALGSCHEAQTAKSLIGVAWLHKSTVARMPRKSHGGTAHLQEGAQLRIVRPPRKSESDETSQLQDGKNA